MYNLDRYTRTEEVYRIANVMNLDELVKLDKAKFIFKLKHGMTKVNQELTYNNDIHLYNTRRQNNIRPKTPRTERILRGLLNSAATYYVSLPSIIVQQDKLGRFVADVKEYTYSCRQSET